MTTGLKKDIWGTCVCHVFFFSSFLANHKIRHQTISSLKMDCHSGDCKLLLLIFLRIECAWVHKLTSSTGIVMGYDSVCVVIQFIVVLVIVWSSPTRAQHEDSESNVWNVLILVSGGHLRMCPRGGQDTSRLYGRDQIQSHVPLAVSTATVWQLHSIYTCRYKWYTVKMHVS